jgi:ribonucleoside-diphosphate reductase alpha chain
MIDTTTPLTSAPSAARSRRASRPTASPTRPTPARSGASRRTRLTIPRTFSDPAVDPFDQIEWDQRTAEITDDSGKTIFRQDHVEVPKSWSQLATKVVCSKYFYGDPAKPERERSVRQLIHRVTGPSPTGASRTAISRRRTARSSTAN